MHVGGGNTNFQFDKTKRFTILAHTCTIKSIEKCFQSIVNLLPVAFQFGQ